MKREYSILWFENDAEMFRSYRDALAEQIAELGFELRAVNHPSITISEVERLGTELRSFNPYDLILFDHELDNGQQGATLAKALRKEIYTDMVYYSSAHVSLLRKALCENEVDGIYVLSRQGIKVDLIEIIRAQISRVCDVNNMRGFVLDVVSDIDERMRNSLSNYVKGVSDEIKERIVQDAKNLMQESISMTTSKQSGLKASNLHKFIRIEKERFSLDLVRKCLCAVRPELDPIIGENSDFRAVQKLRNKFAHQTMVYDDVEHCVRFSESQEDKYTSNSFAETRIKLNRVLLAMDNVSM